MSSKYWTTPLNMFCAFNKMFNIWTDSADITCLGITTYNNYCIGGKLCEIYKCTCINICYCGKFAKIANLF
jgi:hypothetical protein